MLGDIRDHIINWAARFDTYADNSKWKATRLDYTSGDLDYKGLHENNKANTDDGNWRIWKYTWSGDNPVLIEGPLSGSWDNRASLEWA